MEFPIPSPWIWAHFKYSRADEGLSAYELLYKTLQIAEHDAHDTFIDTRNEFESPLIKDVPMLSLQIHGIFQSSKEAATEVRNFLRHWTVDITLDIPISFDKDLIFANPLGINHAIYI
ncbi:hypothetical protein N7470_003379 [Penicillium chermesinum]|nr:hypothetical protein N7470_003379 [Penicillium chermesinum]